MIKARFHAPRELADAYIETALRAASFFTAAEIEAFEFVKIGYVVRNGHQGYVTFFKYDGPHQDGRDPCQQVLMQGPALEYMVGRLAAMEGERAKALHWQMSEGLAMIATFAPHQLDKPKGCKPA